MLSKISSSCLGPSGHSLCTCFCIDVGLRFADTRNRRGWNAVLRGATSFKIIFVTFELK